MNLPIELKQHLLKLHAKLPKNRREAFADAIGRRLSDAATSNLIKYSIVGAAIGAVFEALPGVETLTGIDDWVEVGAALGAWVGLAKDQKKREERERIRVIIDEEVRNALA